MSRKKRKEVELLQSLRESPKRASAGMGGRRGTFEEPFEAGPRSLMVAVFTLALREMTQDPNRLDTWPAKRIDAAKWFLGIGQDDGPGISLEMIAKEFDLDADMIRRVVKAEERMDWEIAEMQRKRLARSKRAGKNRAIDEAMNHG